MKEQEQILKEKFNVLKSALKDEVPEVKATTTFEEIKEYFSEPENGIKYLLDMMAWYIEVQKALDGAKQLLEEAKQLQKEVELKLTKESQVIEKKTIH